MREVLRSAILLLLFTCDHPQVAHDGGNRLDNDIMTKLVDQMRDAEAQELKGNGRKTRDTE
jgi:hypothetical protein